MTHCSSVFDSRKRPRSCEDENCELMPISKRINDLHIRSSFEPTSSAADNSQNDMQSRNQAPSSGDNVCMVDVSESFEKNNNCEFRYKPELSVAENPYYYHVNEVLYEAHVQRLQRVSKVIS